MQALILQGSPTELFLDGLCAYFAFDDFVLVIACCAILLRRALTFLLCEELSG